MWWWVCGRVRAGGMEWHRRGAVRCGTARHDGCVAAERSDRNPPTTPTLLRDAYHHHYFFMYFMYTYFLLLWVLLGIG